MRFILVLCLALLAQVSLAAEPVHYLSVVNDSPSEIQAIELSAPNASSMGTTTERHPSLRGGETMTWGIHDAGQCMRDLLVTFADDQRVIVRDLDICRDRVLHTHQLYVALLRDRKAGFDARDMASAGPASTRDTH